MAGRWADLPAEVQRYLLSTAVSLDGLASFALTSHESCMHAAAALRGATAWKDIWDDTERKRSTERAIFAVSTCSHPDNLADTLLELQAGYDAEEHNDMADDEVIEKNERIWKLAVVWWRKIGDEEKKRVFKYDIDYKMWKEDRETGRGAAAAEERRHSVQAATGQLWS